MRLMLKGIDVSRHQGTVDFTKVKADGIEFVILRDGYSTTEDTKFKTYVEGCRSSGIAVPAVYHFSYALSLDDVEAEAEKCIELVESTGLSKDTWIFYDFEYDTVSSAKKKGKTLSKLECNLYSVVFCDYVKAKGYKTGIYLNKDYYRNWYISDVIKRYPIWLADYNATAQYSCMVHQYSSTGKVNGISTNVDMDYWDKDYEIALEVLDGKWGNGTDRKSKLAEAGYDYSAVQAKVNALLKG